MLVVLQSCSLVCPLSCCRNSKRMPIDVLDALKEVVSKQGNKTKDEAEQFVKMLETKKRLQLETWS